ncbi:MAG TPA: hypothetical protein PKH54_00890 [Myxococcota bacterium]|nr:hypothetical protein [Myxococcota bacterium]HOC98469.1 hypothetical protein [Myxococcota bacterium]HOH77279.1 hypothetical protein [Myxococcota bacterium]HPV03056.1 hypothetical protein [Myxococcota bacterium]
MCSTGIFEIIMLLCFSAAWPFSIARSFRSRSTSGKSLVFLLVILAGYAAGIVHKANCNRDPVISLYIFNGSLVLIDILLYLRNRIVERRASVDSSQVHGRTENTRGEIE